MRYRPLGNSGLQVSELCLGTMTFGQQNTEAEGHAQLDRAVAAGINFIDTAELYPVPSRAETYGATERIVGSWLCRQRRDTLIVATKAAGARRGLPWIRGGNPPFNRAGLRQAVADSLERLRTDYIDLYQLHWPERNTPIFGQYQFEASREVPHTPLLETLEALGELVKEGKIRHIGLSNETPWGVMQTLMLARQHGLPCPLTIQNAYNLLNRYWENGLAEIGYREGIDLLAYSPLGFGFLTGKYRDDPAAVGRATLFEGFAQRYGKPNVAPAVAAYADLARRFGLTPATLAIAFVRTRPFVASTIIGATRMDQLEENLAAAEVVLSDELLQEVEAIHLRYTHPAP